jgi:hypothetical protein
VFIVHGFVNLPSFGTDVVIPGFIAGYVKPLDEVCKIGATVAPITNIVKRGCWQGTSWFKKKHVKAPNKDFTLVSSK